MDHIISLYKEEIETYKQQIVELRQRNRCCDDKNAALIEKIRSLEDIIEKAHVANKDLNTAFEHIREENLRLQLDANSHEPAPPAITQNDKEESKAIEQYATLAQESLTWISERDRMNQRIKFLERECSRYHRDNTTLGKQVRHLLRSLEEERGMIIRHESQLAEEDRVMNASDVIDKHLVTFESIEQLQQQNQKLLTLVKNLSAEQEEREVQFESEEVKRLNIQLSELQAQLDSIKSDRERVLSALNTIHKERDLFKILLCKTRQVEHMTPEIFQRMVSVACAAGPAITDKAEVSAEREAHITDLKEMISKLEQEVAKLKADAELSKSIASEEIKLKNELLEKAHGKIIEETKRADVLNERNEVLEGNIKALTTEFDELRTKCHKLTFDYEGFKKKNDELTEAIMLADKAREELNKTLVDEKARLHDTLIETSGLRDQCQQLGEALERERQHNAGIESEFKRNEERNHEILMQVNELNSQIQQMNELKLQIQQMNELKAEIHQMNELKSQIQQMNELQSQFHKMNELKLQSKQVEELQLEIQRLRELQSRSQQAEDQQAQTEQMNELKVKTQLLEDLQTEVQRLREHQSHAQQIRNSEITNLEQQIIVFQELRNYERKRRLYQARKIRSLNSNRGFVIMKKTRKRSHIHVAKPPQQESNPETQPVPEPKIDQIQPDPQPPQFIKLKRRNFS